jgi:hypothetical protein
MVGRGFSFVVHCTQASSRAPVGAGRALDNDPNRRRPVRLGCSSCPLGREACCRTHTFQEMARTDAERDGLCGKMQNLKFSLVLTTPSAGPKVVGWAY